MNNRVREKVRASFFKKYFRFLHRCHEVDCLIVQSQYSTAAQVPPGGEPSRAIASANRGAGLLKFFRIALCHSSLAACSRETRSRTAARGSGEGEATCVSVRQVARHARTAGLRTSIASTDIPRVTRSPLTIRFHGEVVARLDSVPTNVKFDLRTQ